MVRTGVIQIMLQDVIVMDYAETNNIMINTNIGYEIKRNYLDIPEYRENERREDYFIRWCDNLNEFISKEIISPQKLFMEYDFFNILNVIIKMYSDRTMAEYQNHFIHGLVPHIKTFIKRGSDCYLIIQLKYEDKYMEIKIR